MNSCLARRTSRGDLPPRSSRRVKSHQDWVSVTDHRRCRSTFASDNDSGSLLSNAARTSTGGDSERLRRRSAVRSSHGSQSVMSIQSWGIRYGNYVQDSVRSLQLEMVPSRGISTPGTALISSLAAKSIRSCPDSLESVVIPSSNNDVRKSIAGALQNGASPPVPLGSSRAQPLTDCCIGEPFIGRTAQSRVQ